MSKSLTLAIDEALLRKARVVAVRRGTTVSALVRSYLESVVASDERRRRALRELRAWMRNPVYRVPARAWSRGELHER